MLVGVFGLKNNMIITKLKGGLGNQMFQYATGFALAKKNNVEHKIDISTFDIKNNDTPRKFSLNIFKITSPIALSEEINKIENKNNKITILKTIINQKIFRKYYTDFHPQLFKKITDKISSGKSFYLQGLFQSEKNFFESKSQIGQEFTFKKEFFDQKVLQISELLQKENSVSLHIRRGDYFLNKKTNKYHGLCPIEYYLSAIRYIKSKVPNPSFYLFTDDIKWINENNDIFTKEIGKEFHNISEENFKDYEEMYLMSQCKHNIIANSSFSWWGAWLNKNSDKIVIAPKNWVNKKPNPHPNIIPEKWLKI